MNLAVHSRTGAEKWGAQFGKAQGGSCDLTTRQSPIALSFKDAVYSQLLDNATIELKDVSDNANLEVENDGLKGVLFSPFPRTHVQYIRQPVTHTHTHTLGGGPCLDPVNVAIESNVQKSVQYERSETAASRAPRATIRNTMPKSIRVPMLLAGKVAQ